MHDGSGVGLRARKKERTRRALADAAQRLFAEHGYDRTTVADIAAAADVSPRTFFSYFPSKQAVLDGAGEDRIAPAIAVIATRQPNETPRQLLVRALDAMLVGGNGPPDMTIGPARRERSRRDAEVGRVATALAASFSSSLDPVTGHAMTGAAIGAIDAVTAVGRASGATHAETLLAGQRACRLATRGFRGKHPDRVETGATRTRPR